MTEQQQAMIRDAGFYASTDINKFRKLIAIVREATIRECADVVSDWQSEDSNMTAGESILYNLLDE
jgi:hypothetical protein